MSDENTYNPFLGGQVPDTEAAKSSVGYFQVGAEDPSVIPTYGPKGTIYAKIGSGGGTLYQKQDNGTSTNWLAISSGYAPPISQNTIFVFNSLGTPVPAGESTIGWYSSQRSISISSSAGVNSGVSGLPANSLVFVMGQNITVGAGTGVTAGSFFNGADSVVSGFAQLALGFNNNIQSSGTAGNFNIAYNLIAGESMVIQPGTQQVMCSTVQGFTLNLTSRIRESTVQGVFLNLGASVNLRRSAIRGFGFNISGLSSNSLVHFIGSGTNATDYTFTTFFSSILQGDVGFTPITPPFTFGSLFNSIIQGRGNRWNNSMSQVSLLGSDNIFINQAKDSYIAGITNQFPNATLFQVLHLGSGNNFSSAVNLSESVVIGNNVSSTNSIYGSVLITSGTFSVGDVVRSVVQSEIAVPQAGYSHFTASTYGLPGTFTKTGALIFSNVILVPAFYSPGVGDGYTVNDVRGATFYGEGTNVTSDIGTAFVSTRKAQIEWVRYSVLMHGKDDSILGSRDTFGRIYTSFVAQNNNSGLPGSVSSSLIMNAVVPQSPLNNINRSIISADISAVSTRIDINGSIIISTTVNEIRGVNNSIIIGNNMTVSGLTASSVMAVGANHRIVESHQYLLGQGINTGRPGVLFGLYEGASLDAGIAFEVSRFGEIRMTSGGQRVRARTLASGGSVDAATDYFVAVTNAGSTITLPSGVDGKVFKFKNRSSGNLTIVPNGTQTINGAANLVLSANGATEIIFLGTDWAVV